MPEYVPDGMDAGVIGTHCRTDDPDVPSSVKENWFNAPVTELSFDSSKLTVTAALSDGKVVLTGSKVSGASFSFARASAKLGESIIITDSSGELVAGSLALSDASTAPTITFTPAQSANEPASVTVTSSLKDNFGTGCTPMTDNSL